MVVPTAVSGTFTTAKGATLGAFGYYFLCEGQRQAQALGYSPLPINLVQAGLAQVKRIPGVSVQSVDIKKCNNPTFSADGTNTLAKTAPQPAACDKKGPTQCTTGTGGATQATANSGTAGGGTSTTGGATTTNGSTTGSSTTGGGTTSVSGDATTTGAATDPETGAVGETLTASGQQISAVPVSLPTDDGWSTTRTLMLLAAALLIALVTVPPLVARSLQDRSPR
jgi:phosphate transport system substrate-binding protein